GPGPAGRRRRRPGWHAGALRRQTRRRPPRATRHGARGGRATAPPRSAAILPRRASKSSRVFQPQGMPMELALVDFDHTVTTCDTYGRFLRHVATPEQLASSRWSVGPWVAGYRLGLVSASALRVRVTRKVFNGRDAAEIAAIGADYARDVLPRVVRPEMLGRIAEHRARGHEVVIVSGSLDVYLEPWCRGHGLDWICNRLESEAGRLTGR